MSKIQSIYTFTLNSDHKYGDTNVKYHLPCLSCHPVVLLADVRLVDDQGQVAHDTGLLQVRLEDRGWNTVCNQ